MIGLTLSKRARTATALGVSALLLACGGAQASAYLAGPDASVSTNSLPMMSGTPRTNLQAGETFHFAPTASDPDGDALTFSASGLPDWATLDPATGAVSGTTQAGVSAPIVITASDGVDSVRLAAFALRVGDTRKTAANHASSTGG